jgi:hypothetical protein
MLLVLLVVICCEAAVVSEEDINVNNTNLCFAQRCNGNFSSGKIEVLFGGFLQSLNEISTSQSAAGATGEFWMSWPICAVTDSGDLFRPDLTFDMSNGLPFKQFSPLIRYPTCDVLPGRAYQRWTFVGNYDQEFYFRPYPLDSHTLHFDVADQVYPLSELEYIPDTVNVSPYPQTLIATGWTTVEQDVWGIIDTQEKPIFENSTTLVNFTRARMQVTLTRGTLVYGFRILPPIIILLYTNVLSGVLSFEHLGQRLALNVAGLLTTVFLQFSFAWGAPLTLAYPTRLDWLIFCCYVILCLCVLEVFVCYGIMNHFFKKLKFLKKKKKRALALVGKDIDKQWEATPENIKEQKIAIRTKIKHLRIWDIALVIFLAVASFVCLVTLSTVYIPSVPVAGDTTTVFIWNI